MSFSEGEKAYIIENNSHVTPVRIIRKDGEFYTIQFEDYGRINLRGKDQPEGKPAVSHGRRSAEKDQAHSRPKQTGD